MQPLSAENKQVNEEVMDITKYLSLLSHNWLRLAIFSVSMTILTTLVVFSITPKYVATATLLIESEQKKVISIEEVVGIDSSQKEYYLTQFEILKSNQIAERVIKELRLDTYPEFNDTLNSELPIKKKLVEVAKSLPILGVYFQPKKQTEEEIQESLRQSILAVFRENLAISPVRQTQLVNIRFESEDPKLAAKIANAVGHAYIQENLDARLSATKEASLWISSRLQQLKQQLQSSEQALTDFLSREKLIDDSGIDAQARTEINNLSERLTQLTDRRIEIESSYTTLKNAQELSDEVIISIPLISKHPQVLTLTELKVESEKQISELAKRYGPEHEKMITAMATLASTNSQLKKVVRDLVSGIDQERATIISQEKLIAAELKDKKEAFQSLTVKMRQYESLERELETNRDLFNLFLTRQKETSATSDFEAESARFTDYAMIPQRPASPKKGLIIALSFVVSLGFAVVLVFLLDALRNTIESVKNFEERFGLIPLGGIPMVQSQRFKNKDLDNSLFLDNEQISFSESVRSLRTALTLANMQSGNKVLAVTSSLPKEGKTTTSINLAMAYAQVGNTLLIDADLRKPAVAERFGYKKYQQGLTNHLLMNQNLEECFIKDEKSGLTILPAGMLTPNPQELLSSEKFETLIKTLETRFDRIVIDTPPTLPVADSLIISRLVGSIVIVVKANSTRISNIKNTLASFMTHEIKIDGVIINQVTQKSQQTEYGYGSYYGSYGDNYTEQA